MNQINANAPTPGEIMELAKENERLKGVIEAMESSRQKFALEQQIKALKLRIHDNASYDDFGFNIIYVDDLMDYIEQFESKLQLGDVLCKRTDRRVRTTAQGE